MLIFTDAFSGGPCYVIAAHVGAIWRIAGTSTRLIVQGQFVDVSEDAAQVARAVADALGLDFPQADR